MTIEGEHCVQRDPQYFGGLIEGGYDIIYADLWMDAVLTGPGGEEGGV